MTDKELTEWEHQPHVITVLTSREMGAWLGRRDNRLVQEIRQEIEVQKKGFPPSADYYKAINRSLDIIDKYIKWKVRDKE